MLESGYIYNKTVHLGWCVSPYDVTRRELVSNCGLQMALLDVSGRAAGPAANLPSICRQTLLGIFFNFAGTYCHLRRPIRTQTGRRVLTNHEFRQLRRSQSECSPLYRHIGTRVTSTYHLFKAVSVVLENERSKNIPRDSKHQYTDKSSRSIQKANVIMVLNNFQLSSSRKSRVTLSARQKSRVMCEVRMFSVLFRK